jgi:hypothetical protein
LERRARPAGQAVRWRPGRLGIAQQENCAPLESLEILGVGAQHRVVHLLDRDQLPCHGVPAHEHPPLPTLEVRHPTCTQQPLARPLVLDNVVPYCGLTLWQKRGGSPRWGERRRLPIVSVPNCCCRADVWRRLAAVHTVDHGNVCVPATGGWPG